MSSGRTSLTLDDYKTSHDDTINEMRREASESTISSTHMHSASSLQTNDDENDDDMSFHDETNFQNVSGTVRCSKDGMGVKGVDVHLVDVSQTGNSTVIVKTDTKGNFTFSNVQSGTYSISIKETDVQPNTSNVTRLMSSKVITVQDRIDVDRVILFRYGSSIGNRNDSELNKKDRSLPEFISKPESINRIHKGNKAICMRGLSIGTEESWDNLKYDDDISFQDEAMDVILEKCPGEATTNPDEDGKGPYVTNVNSAMCMRGLSWDPETFPLEMEETSKDGEGSNPSAIYMRGLSLDPEIWESGDTNKYPIHNKMSLQKVSGTVCCDEDEIGFREANVHLVDAGHAGISTVTVKTDTNGNFMFSNVQSGIYTIRVQPLPNTLNDSRLIPLPKVVTVEDGIDVDGVIFRHEPSTVNKNLQGHDSPLSDDKVGDVSNKPTQGDSSRDKDEAGDEVRKKKGASTYSLHLCTIAISLAVIVLLKTRKR